MTLRTLALALALALMATPALAQDAEIEEIRTAWTACTALVEKSPNEWTGWRRNFDGGYADHFQFHEATDGSGVLVQTWLIDAIATQKDTSCFRKDGSLAFIYSEMTSPNMAQGASGPAIVREGRLYFAPDGRLVRVLRRIMEADREVAPMDNERYQLARGCGLTEPHATIEDVRSHMISELGDIEGTRGEFKIETLDWCSLPTN